MKRLIWIVSGIALGLLLAVFVNADHAGANADDLIKVSPNNYKVLLDNDRVRILEYHLKPGEKEKMHTHYRLTFVYSLNAATYENIPRDGAAQKVSVKAGEVSMRQPDYTHMMNNTGKTEIASVVFELKDTPMR
jgi:mannose-6-phosphate isomerase-like protein (cupin superfamily)